MNCIFPGKMPRRCAATLRGAILAIAISRLQAAALTVETWIGQGAGNWSDSTRWLDGSAPAGGGDDLLAVHFANVESASVAANLDLGIFSLNRLDFDARYPSAFQITSTTGSALRFAGADPSVSLRGFSSAAISTPVLLAAPSPTLRIGGEAPATLTLSGAIGEEAGTHGLAIETTAPRTDIGAVQLFGANTFSGGVELRSGNLFVNHASALGSGALTVRGGSLRLGAISLENNAVLHSDLVLVETGNATWSGVISSAVANAGLVRRGGGALTLTGASTFTGETTLDASLSPLNALLAGPGLTLSGGGSLQSSGFNIHAGSRLTIEAGAGGSTDRVADLAPMRLRSGQVRFSDATGNTVAKTETIGTVNLAGHSTVAVAGSATATATLNVAGFSRGERGTLLVAGINSGGNARLFANAAPDLAGGGASGPATSIVPWAIGDSGADFAGSSFVTYTAAGGFRLLNIAGDYAASFLANQNTRLTSAFTLSAPATANALWLANGSVNGTGQTLTLTGGALASGGAASISANLNFNAAEAVITPVSGTLTVSGPISGSGGLTKAGEGTLALRTANAFSGPLTINAGLLDFTDPNQLGASGGPIAINGTRAGLSYSGAAAVTLARPLALNTGVASIQNAGPGELTLSGGTQGPGGWFLSQSYADARIRLTGVATHTGFTILAGGTFSFAADSALGSGDLRIASSTTLDLAGAWSTSRRIAFDAPLVLKTNGFDVVWKGPLTGPGPFSGGSVLSKTTAGNLRIESPSGLSSGIFFDSGRLEIGGAGILRNTSVQLTGGAALVLDNAAQVESDRFAGNGAIELKNGELRLEGNATTPVVETVAMLGLNQRDAPGNDIISVTAPGTAGTILKLGSIVFIGGSPAPYPVALPPVLIRGTQLGGSAGGAFSRVVFTGAMPGAPIVFQDNFLADDLSGLATSFAVYDSNSDAAGVLGFRPLAAAEYASGANIQNPGNGGATPLDAHLLLSGAGGATGAVNSAQTLTLGAGGALTLSAGQTLSLSRGALLARAGGAAASVSGGTLDGGASAVSLHLAGDLQLGSNVTTSAGVLRKFGAGALILESGAHLPATVLAHSGPVRTADATALADSLVSLAPRASLELDGAINAGGLAGVGAVRLGSHTLTLGTLPADFTFGGTISGEGALRIVDGGRTDARRTLTGANTHTGGVILDSGTLLLGTGQALGSGPLVVNGGNLGGVATGSVLGHAVVNNPIVLNGTLTTVGNLILGENVSFSGAGTLLSGDSGLRIRGVVDFAGTAVLSPKVTYSSASPWVSMFIEGGSLRPRGGVTLDPNAWLILYGSAFAGGCLADDLPLLTRSGILHLANTSETIGTLRAAGFSTLRLEPSDTGGITLTAAGLERVGRGTFEILATKALGTSGAGASFVRFTTAPPTADGGVLPYAVGRLNGTSDNYGVVVHDPANGVRLLASGEYTTSIAAATPASHLLVPTTGDLINGGSLTVRSLNLGAAGSGLKGGGNITVASGLVLAGTRMGTVDNAILFGANEAFIGIEDSRWASIEFLRPLSGNGGLTVFGRGLVSFSGGNQIAGPLVLNGAARILLTNAAQLGPDASAIQINGREMGAGFQVNAGSVTISRPIQVNSGYLATSAPGTGAELVLNGPITGPGGVFASYLYGPVNTSIALGFTVLAGANTYGGPTVVEGNLAFASDAALGNSSAIVLSGGAIKLLGNWTTTRRFEPSNLSNTALTLDTNGFDATFRGVLAKGSLAPLITKRGAGAFTIATPQDEYDRTITVQGGQLVLGETGRLSRGSVAVSQGGAFIIDNRAQVAMRGSIPVALDGGEFIVHGHATQPTTLTSTIIAKTGSSTVTLSPQPGASVTFDNTSVSVSLGAWLLLRGERLGGSDGGFTRVRAGTAPALVNGLLPRLIVDASATGGGSSFATYDAAQDAAGTIGIRPLNAAEYAHGGEIRNPANGGGTVATANFLAAGNVTSGGAVNTLNTLTLDSGARVAMSPGQTLALSQSAILVRSGAPATIAGGTLLPASSRLDILGGGELRLGAVVPATSILQMLGPGVLTVTAPQKNTTFFVGGGSLRAVAGDPLAITKIQLDPGGWLELRGIATHIPELNGTGTVDLGGATLSVTGNFSTNTASRFAGSIAGTGAFEASGSAGITLSGASPFAGSLVVSGGKLTLSGTAPGVSGVFINSGTFSLDNQAALSGAPRLAAPPVAMSSGSLWLYGDSYSETVAPFGRLSGEGFNYVRISNSSSYPGGRMIFGDLVRQNRGTFAFVANEVSRYEFNSDLGGSLIGNPAIPTQRPVLPFGVVNDRPATFEPGVGLRPLSSAEQSSTLTAGDNVRLTQFINFNGDITINSLDSTTSGALTGTGIVRIASGLVTGGGTVSIAMDFGNAEGLIFNMGGGPSYNGPISGTNGVTISNLGSNTTSLNGSNTFTGPITVNGGGLIFKSAANFGPDLLAIVLRDAKLVYGGTGAFTLMRGVELRGAFGGFDRAPGSTAAWTMAGAISGPGGLTLNGNITLANSANSYTGATTVAGTVRFASDAVFGQSPTLVFAGGLLSPTADWTTSRPAQFGYNGSGTIDTGVFTSTLNGALTGYFQLTKSGSGRLIVNNGGEFTGPIVVSAGALRLNGALGASGGITVAAGARLEGNSVFNRPVALSGTLAPGASAGILEMGNLTLQGGSTLELELFRAAEFDQLRVDGTVTFNGLVQLALDFGGATFSTGIDFPFLLNDGTDPIAVSLTKAFAIGTNVLEENEIFFVGNQPVRITYAGGDGNDVSLSVPELSTGAALAAGLCSLVVRRRRWGGSVPCATSPGRAPLRDS